MTRMAIVGSRGFTDWFRFQDEVDRIVDIFSSTGGVELVSGGARGPDKMAERYAKETGLHIRVFPADWDAHGKKAGMLRNKDIVDNSDVVIAFWDNKSKGTENTIKTALKQGKRVFTIYI